MRMLNVIKFALGLALSAGMGALVALEWAAWGGVK